MGKQKPTNRSCRRELMLKPRNVITLKSGVRERGREREFFGHVVEFMFEDFEV